MRRFFHLIPPMLAGIIALGAITAPARATSGIQDNATVFTHEAISQGDTLIKQIRAKSGHDVYIVTFSEVPTERQSELFQKGKQLFFADWADFILHDSHVNGILILICKNPGHLETKVDARILRAFTVQDQGALRASMLQPLKGTEKDFDRSLISGLELINDRIKPGPANNTANAPSTPGYSRTSPPVSTGSGNNPGAWLCVGIVIILVVALIIGFISRSRGGYPGGYGAPPQGGYPPGYGGYGGGYYGGGGGGFGRGLLGGILGGALGSWGYNRFFQGGNQSTYLPPTDGSAPPPDTSGGYSSSSMGGDFDSSPPSGGDFGSSDSSSSSDFGSSASGGDFGGGGGGDFGGGGGSTGGDF